MSDPIPLSLIDREGRVRNDYGNIEELAENIYVNGLIHPLCVNIQNKLVAGGRRSRALDYILEHWGTFRNNGLVCHPEIEHFIRNGGELLFGVHYTNKDVEDDGDVAELELIENVMRHNFTWQEEVQAIARVHRIRTKQKALDRETWTQLQTGRLFGISRANVSYCLIIAEYLKDEKSPVWKCSGVVEAMSYHAKFLLDKANIELAKQIKEKASTIPTVVTPNAASEAALSDFIQQFNPDVFTSSDNITSPSDEFGPAITPPPTPETITQLDQNKAIVEDSMRVATSIVHHMDCMDFFKLLGKDSVDAVITDPPYAIEMSNLAQNNTGQQDIDRVAETHDVKDNLENFPKWLQGCYDIIKPKGYCVWFCDYMHFAYLVELGQQIGFKVQRWPFVWLKTSSCQNQRAELNFTKDSECAVIMRKPGGRLVRSGPRSSWTGGMTAEDKAASGNHPFAKPFELWEAIISPVVTPGGKIAEPFSGGGSGTRAMMKLGYLPIACEKDEKHFAHQVNTVANTYCQMNSVNFGK